MNTHTLLPLPRNATRLVGLLLTLCAGHLMAQEKSDVEKSAHQGWVTDFEAAKKTAAAEGKDLLLEFTRSEGCGWCIKLEKEVFAQEAFKKKVPKDYVLVKLEFPRDKELSAELKEQNNRLFKHYGVWTFPYMVFCDPTGRPYGSMVYKNSTLEKCLKDLDSIQERRNLRDQALADAKSLQGEPKARMLEKALSNVNFRYQRHYTEVIDEISKSDPNDTSGLIAKIRVREVHASLSALLRPHYQEENHAGIPAVVDAYIAEHKLQGESYQAAQLFKIQALYQDRNYPEALKVAKEILAINDTSHSSRYAKMLKKRIEQLQEKASKE